MDKIAEWMINKIDRWYVKSSLPTIIKEFVFVFVVLTSTLSVEGWNWIKNVLHRRS